ncbi:outer membrane receptor protein involved in Fe transport [Parabacteroides sp. PFB2-12]|uniref:TonB-dependent receptor plug domain-containing protein n=1 Tax=unclassified Parabacteroides TaxID=2649774 RepID=UPI00247430A6|nr:MULTISPECIES: TonB-dependent receptor [unclassified Parabacteroides]MDH6343993.1 outer membrane receptor protein involved in Fe transport [Parabacteroides sp. PM6-13]MDH6391853.1 outer membrane receptor protein involved in Fe transport [Parabacteroides sp. PFB2-12]
MKSQQYLCSILLVMSGCFTKLSAQDSYTAQDSILLQEVVVSATKTEVTRNQIPLSISVVDRPALQESTETGVLSILSEQVPGVFVTERGVTGYGISSGSAGSVSIHGVGGGNKVLMLFDGQPMWAGVFGHHVPDVYVASDAEKVEVIRGPGSLLYGSNAMGGVINVITRKAKEDGLHGQGRVMYGSYDTWKFMGNAGYKKNKFNAYLSLNRDQTDGQRDNSSFYINNGYLRLGYHFSNNWNMNGSAVLADFKVHNPGPVQALMYENWAKALRTTYSVTVNNVYEKMSGSLQAYYNSGQHKINDGHTAEESPQTSYFRSDDYNMGMALYESFRLLDGNVFTIGLDAKQWGGKAWNEDFDGNELVQHVDKKVNEFAAYVVAQQTLFDKLVLNAGVRLENNEIFGNEWVPQAGISYQLNDQATLKASLSKGFRSPNIRELYMWGLSPNPDLRPESMLNYDISYMQSLLNNRLHVEVTAYFAKGKNQIVPGKVGDKQMSYNSGAFRNRGFDVGVNYQIRPNLKLSGNYSFLDSDIRVEAAPKHKAYLGLHWRVKKFTLSPGMQYVDGLYVGKNNGQDMMESYALLNCKLAYKPTPWMNLFLNGENLTDTSYQNMYGYPMPGVVVLGGIDVTF